MEIVLVEDDIKIAEFIIDGFHQIGATVTHCEDGITALSVIEEDSFDVAIFDIMVPKLDGLTLLEIVRKKKIALPVIILSAKNSVDDRVNGLNIGADDYLTKPFAFAELSARVSALTRRETTHIEERLSVKDLTVDLIRKRVTRGSQTIQLQPKELALLEYLLRNRGRVISKSMIMEEVWGYSFDTQTNVVEARISNLRKKIEGTNNEKIIETIRGVGYVIKD